MMAMRMLLLAAWLVGTSLMPVHAQTDATPAREYRVLLVGNSLTYTNNLPALLRAVGASQGTPIATESFAAPGGTLIERWNDGHVAEALRSRGFDAVVLQEQGGNLAACMASVQQQRKAPCAASLRAYTEFAQLATVKGAKVLVFATWGPDERWQGKLAQPVPGRQPPQHAGVLDAGAGALPRHHRQRAGGEGSARHRAAATGERGGLAGIGDGVAAGACRRRQGRGGPRQPGRTAGAGPAGARVLKRNGPSRSPALTTGRYRRYAPQRRHRAGSVRSASLPPRRLPPPAAPPRAHPRRR